MQWLSDNGINVLKDWPPIEHLWSFMHREIARLHPKTESQLRKVALKVWDSITLEQINGFVRAFPGALAKTVELNGEPW